MKMRFLALLISLFTLHGYSQNTDPILADEASPIRGFHNHGAFKVDNVMVMPVRMTFDPLYANPALGYRGRIQTTVNGGNTTLNWHDGTIWKEIVDRVYVDAKVAQSITDGVTTSSPSQDVLHDVLINKADLIGGKIPLSQINDALIGSVNYQGSYNAATNSPTLPTATGNKGKYYIVTVAGIQQSLTLNIGDWIISNGTTWGKVDNNNAVTSVAGKVGAVSLVIADIASLQSSLDLKAPNASPTLTGDPKAPTPTAGDNDTSIATSAFTKLTADAKIEDNLSPSTTVGASKTAVNTALALKANDNNVMHLTGNETAGGTKTFANPVLYGGTNFESTLGDWVSVKNKLVSGNWARGHNITDTAGSPYAEYGVYGTGQTFNYAYLGLGSNPSASAPIKYTSTGVGINLPLVATPTVPLEINGTVLIKDGSGGTQLKIERGTGGVYFSQLLNTDRLILANKANTLSYQTWFEDGNITIGGTTNATYKLDVQGTGRYTGKLIAANFEIPFGAATSSRSWMIRNDLNSSGDFSIGTYSDKTNTTFINRIWISPVGNVSIGNNADNSFKLDVTGNAIIRGTATVNNAPVSSTDVARKLELDLKADLASPALTGNPTAPTATAGDNDTTVATTAFVTNAIGTASGSTIARLNKSTVAYNFPSIASGGYADYVFATGGTFFIGDFVDLVIPITAILPLVDFKAWVSNTGEVTIRCTNMSGSPVDLALLNYVYCVWR